MSSKSALATAGASKECQETQQTLVEMTGNLMMPLSITEVGDGILSPMSTTPTEEGGPESFLHP
jgi:hypothetical protein